MNRIKITLAAFLVLALSAGCASMITAPPPPLPAGTLDAPAVTALFSGRTVTSTLLKNGRVTKMYYNPNGQVNQLQYGKRSDGTWRVTKNGRICLSIEGDREKCRIIVQEGGSYYKYIVKDDGNHKKIIRYNSFKNGNLIGP